MTLFRLTLMIALLGPLAAQADFDLVNDYTWFRRPIDLRRVEFSQDWTVSQSLGTRLVRVGSDSEPISGLADTWQVDPQGQWIEFHIDDRAQWSDGSPITPHDIVESFEDLRKTFKKDFPAVMDLYTAIEERAPRFVRFKVKRGISPNGLLKKISDTQFGLVKLIKGKPSLQITSGPYWVKSVTKDELTLSINKHWLFYSPDSPKEVHLRPHDGPVRPSLLNSDPWPSRIYVEVGVTKSDVAKLPPETPMFRLNHDRIMGFYVGRRSDLQSTRTLVGFIRANADFAKFASILDDGVEANQIYAKGLALHSDHEPRVTPMTAADFLKVWKKKSIRIGYFKDSPDDEIIGAAKEMLQKIVPVPVEFIEVSHEKIHRWDKSDLIFVTTGADNENLDGGLSYFIERPPFRIPSDKSEKGNFKLRLKNIRKSDKDPILAYRDLVTDVVEGNYFLPVAHFSTLIVGRKNIDFSNWTRFGDSFPFYALRKIE